MTHQETRFHTDRFTRGGQIVSHKWRMRIQNIKVALIPSLIATLFILIVVSWMYQVTYWMLVDFYLATYFPGWCKVWTWHIFQPYFIRIDQALYRIFSPIHMLSWSYCKVWDLESTLHLSNGQALHWKTIQFLKDTRIQEIASQVHSVLLWCLAAFISAMAAIYRYFSCASLKMEEPKILDGGTVSDLFAIAKRIRKEGASDYLIAPGLPYPKDGENKHTAIMGATRTGKTTCIIHLLNQVRDKGQRAVILDATGEFTQRYYRPDQDFLINPKDSRSVSWNIWNEHLDVYGYKAWADSFVPESKGDPIWYLSARRLLAETAQLLQHDPERSMKKLLHIACNQALNDDLLNFYKNSSVESLVNKDSEKQTTGIRLQLSSYINAFDVLKEDDSTPFSVLNWVKENKKKDQWLFLLSTPTQRATLAPFVASMFNFAFLGLEGAGVDFKNRLWMVTDEIAGWGIPITALKRMVTEGAKYGACCVLGFQNKSQTDELYGYAGTKIISSNCNTKIMFRSPDSETAHDLSQNIGTQEVLLPSEGFSLGAHHMRDGVSLSSQRRIQSVVSSNDIMRREDLTAYVQLPGNFPIVEVQYDRLGD